jgi:hypothetical protein
MTAGSRELEVLTLVAWGSQLQDCRKHAKLVGHHRPAVVTVAMERGMLRLNK